MELTACPGEGLLPGARWTQGLPKQWPTGILRRSGTRYTAGVVRGWVRGMAELAREKASLQSGKTRRGPVAASGGQWRPHPQPSPGS